MCRESQLTGRARLRRLAEYAEARGEEMDAEAQRFRRLADPSAAPRVVSAFNLFQTPPALAARMAALLPQEATTAPARVLEPSAGLGRLYGAFRAAHGPGASVVLVDESPDCCRELYHATAADSRAHLAQRDFLGCTGADLGAPFDAVLMNPPFCRGTDLRHLRHALTMLRAGGVLVGLAAAGGRKRAAVEALGGRYEELPAGSFRSEGTAVAAALVTFGNTTEG